MLRRWCISLTTLALIFGSMLAVAGTASAASMMHPATTGVAHPSVQPGGIMVRPGSGFRPGARSTRDTTVESTNWSGYAVTGGNGAFKSVSASWTEPTGTCSTRKSSYSSFWVGLDGFNSSSVEQTGTDVDCSRLTPRYYGWYEMYPAFPVNFSNPVKPGDHLSASVTFSGSQTFTLVLHDATRGWTQTITKNQSGLARSSAEVITEAPSSTSGVLPLADFGKVNYSVSAANGTSLGSRHPTEIIMVDNHGAPKDSTSAISSTGAFSNTWIRSN